MKKRATLASLFATAAPAVATAKPSDKHVRGCNTHACDKRIGAKWWAKHKPKLPKAVATVSWYGPGFYGRPMACGGAMSANDDSVAHKSLPCGTKVRMCLNRCTTAVVRDRGPYIPGRTFDLTPGVKSAIGMSGGTAQVRYAVIG
jgi:rare lipoprotein A (peptidoglycan hydrolase)